MCPGSRGLSPSGRSLSGEESHSESCESDDSDEEHKPLESQSAVDAGSSLSCGAGKICMWHLVKHSLDIPPLHTTISTV